MVLAIWLGSHAMAQGQWNIVSVDRRHYVSLANISRFYGMSTPMRSGEKSLTMLGNGHSFQVTLERRESSIDGVKHWLSFPVILHDGVPHVSRMDVAKTIEPAFRLDRVPGLGSVATVVLDPGHGGHDKGARSAFGFEKDAALDVARRIRKRLQQAGLRVIMTRDSDSFVPLERRAAIAARQKKAIFVSLHFNSAAWNPAASGLEIFAMTPRGAPPTDAIRPAAADAVGAVGHAVEGPSFALATTVFHTLLGTMGMIDRGVKRERFAVLRLAGVPSILIEGGFFTNSAEAAILSTSAWRDRYAGAVAAGILEYKRLAEQRVLPKRLADYRKAPVHSAGDRVRVAPVELAQ